MNDDQSDGEGEDSPTLEASKTGDRLKAIVAAEADLPEAARSEACRQEITALTLMRGMDLDDPEIMAKAWRT